MRNPEAPTNRNGGRHMRPPLQLTAAAAVPPPPPPPPPPAPPLLLLSPHVSPSPPSPPGSSSRGAPLSAAACIEALLEQGREF